jgi:CheY-like chemotaxis protein/REP element-mobilizing transposase RayT
MALRVLIVSPDAGFGGLIQQTLDNSGEYEPVLVVNGRQALELASKLPFDLAILDADMTGFDMVELGMALQALSPDVRLIVIPGIEPVDHLTQAGLSVCGYLSKPFYLPDLLEVVGKALQVDKEALRGEARAASQLTQKEILRDASQAEAPAQISPEGDALPWLENPDRAAQHLARLSMESASQAALILNRGRLWAYAGHLSRAAALELAEIIQHDWQRQRTRTTVERKASDLVRFVRLRSTGEDTMLYATSLGDELLLVLAFDVRTPISKIHSQASELARALAGSHDPDFPKNVLASTKTAKSLNRPAAPAVLPEAPGPPVQGSPSVKSQAPESGALQKSEAYVPETPISQPVAPLPLDDIPPPTPPEYKGEIPRQVGMQWPWELDPELDDQDESMDELPQPKKAVAAHVGTSAQARPADARASSEAPRVSTLPESPEVESVPYPLPDELRPVSKMILSSPVVYVIHYACVLLPRMPEHQLRADLPALLMRWMRQISLVSGWRLEHVTVNSDYLHWIAGVAPESPAVEVIHLVRQQTSAWIFAECPAYARDNPSSDFWAPGYLVVTGSRPLPAPLIKEYIRQTRIRQGVAGEN